MTGYLPYLIEKHGYSEQSVIRWIENQLKRYANIFVTSNMDEFNIIVIGRSASSVYHEKFIKKRKRIPPPLRRRMNFANQ